MRRPLLWIILGVVLAGATVFVMYPTIFIKKPSQTVSDRVNELQNMVMETEDYAKCLGEANGLVKKYPANKDIWQWKAICEFQLGNFSEAKTSFETLLVLDPESAVAKNYLETLNSGSQLINTESDQQITRAQFESRLGLDLSKFDMSRLIRLPSGSDYSEFIEGTYFMLQPFSTVVADLEQQLKDKKIPYTKEQFSGYTTFISTSPLEGQSGSRTITVFQGASKTTVVANFVKSKLP